MNTLRLRRAAPHLCGCIVLIATAWSLPGAQLGCSRFKEPCRLSDEVTLFSDPSLDGLSGTLLEGPAGDTVLRFITYKKPEADAGVEAGDVAETGAGAGGLGGFGTVALTSPVPSKVDIVVSAVSPGAFIRKTFVAPMELQARAGSTVQIAATYTGQAVLFSWVEQSTHTDPDGLVHTGAALRYAVSSGGTSFSAELARACDDCTIQATAVAKRGTTFIFYSAVQQGKTKPFGGVVRMDPLGVAVEHLPVPSWFVSAAVLPRLSLSNGTLLARLSTGSYVVRDDLALEVGPFVPKGSAVAFVYGDGDPYGAWLETPGTSASGDGGAVFGDLGFDDVGSAGQNLMLGRYSAGGTATRISTASNVLGVARGQGTFGVAFVAGEREYFALAGADGQKVGGDVDIGGALATSLEAAAGRRVLRSVHAPASFSILGLSGSTLLSREVTCD